MARVDNIEDMKIFWVFNHPAPYKVRFFNALGINNDLTVYFERHFEKGRNLTFYSEQVHSFHALYGHPLKLGAFDNFSFKAKAILKEHQEDDIVVINGWRTLTEQSLIRYCKRQKIPYVFAINGGIVKKDENNISYSLKRDMISGASLYLAPDENSVEYLKHYGADPKRIRLFPYGSVSDEEILPEPVNEKTKTRVREKKKIQGTRAFVATGYFVKRKNFDRLIEIWRDMPKDNALYLIGEGREKKTYMRLIKKYHLENVFILPYMNHKDLFSIYRAFDGFLLPTKEDIYGHVVIEALARGLPVFASSCSNAAKMVVKDGVNGRLLDFNNTEEVVLALTKGFDPNLAPACIESSRAYSFERSALEHDKIFAAFLEERK